MAWNLAGTYLETCNCSAPCPCVISLDLGADNDYCGVVLAFNIESGDVDGMDVGGIGAALVVRSPKVMSEGGWKVGLFIDQAASDDQAEALGQVFSGQLGGPPAALAPLLGEFLGVERAPIEFHDDGRTHSLRIGDAVDVEIEDVVPFGAEDGEPARVVGIVHPLGDTLTISKARRSEVKAFGLDLTADSAFSLASFAWAG
jgi:hypothetical protein